MLKLNDREDYTSFCFHVCLKFSIIKNIFKKPIMAGDPENKKIDLLPWPGTGRAGALGRPEVGALSFMCVGLLWVVHWGCCAWSGHPHVG